MSGSGLYNNAAFVTGLMAFILFVIAIASFEGYVSANVVGTFAPADWAFLGILSAIVAVACYSKANE